MAENTNISWATHTWNPVTGCTQVSPGCDNCYALTLAEQKRGTPAFPVGFDLMLRPHKINDPAKWKDPSLVFVNSMSDLFHVDVPDEYICQVWETMVRVDWHIYQLLTKRPHRMGVKIAKLGLALPPHIWLGTSVESQKWAENRIPVLDMIPAEIKWLSCEPLLGPLDLRLVEGAVKGMGGIAWVVTGGESGPNRRPADPRWFWSLRDQCVEAGVAFFHKQGNHLRPGKDRILQGRTWDEYPDFDHPALNAIRSELWQPSAIS